ncbi:MAG: hypothetical protein JWN99_3350, partial [Ilumatobacteraceae bacterium]|nr:hypothetical protein [Ilumatobacteraceae bacterium]
SRNGQLDSIANVTAGVITELVVAGRGGVLADASAVVLNVTATNTAGPGFVTVWPCGVDRPLASSLNFAGAGVTTPNAVVVGVGTGGKVCLYSSAAADLVVDVNGAFPADDDYADLVPNRLFDSRNGQLDSIANVTAGVITELVVAGRGGVPADASAVVLNVTATNTAGPGFVTVWPCGVERPLASSLNFSAAGVTTPNAVVVGVGVEGKVCLYSSAAADLVVDVNGAFPAQTGGTASYSSLVPSRLLDTRVLA